MERGQKCLQQYPPSVFFALQVESVDVECWNAPSKDEEGSNAKRIRTTATITGAEGSQLAVLYGFIRCRGVCATKLFLLKQVDKKKQVRPTSPVGYEDVKFM